MITKNGSSKQQIPFTTPFFPPCTFHRRANPHLQKRMAGATYMHAHQKKENGRPNRKKSLKKHKMCCGVFHQKIQNIPTATKNNGDIVEITKFKVRIWH
jgi:uncharacterized protein (DUF849 family)